MQYYRTQHHVALWVFPDIINFLAAIGPGMYLQVAYTFTAENYPTMARSSGFGITDGIGHDGGVL